LRFKVQQKIMSAAFHLDIPKDPRTVNPDLFVLEVRKALETAERHWPDKKAEFGL
jgi:hypothetical protein